MEARLKHFYQRPGKAEAHVFALVHQARAAGLGVDDTYPQLAGYCLLVREFPADTPTLPHEGGKELEEYMERFIVEAMQAEFTAYLTLPVIRQESLEPYFWQDSPAMKEILTSLHGCSRRGWVLSNSLNPSTHRVMSVRFKERRDGELLFASEEYWYLKWWDTQQQQYAYAYRETNRQSYVLRRQGGLWKIYQNIRPLPRTSIPLRWKNRRK